MVICRIRKFAHMLHCNASKEIESVDSLAPLSNSRSCTVFRIPRNVLPYVPSRAYTPASSKVPDQIGRNPRRPGHVYPLLAHVIHHAHHVHRPSSLQSAQATIEIFATAFEWLVAVYSVYDENCMLRLLRSIEFSFFFMTRVRVLNFLLLHAPGKKACESR